MFYEEDVDSITRHIEARKGDRPTKGFRHASEIKYDDITIRSKRHLEASGFAEIFEKEIDVLGENILQSPLEKALICHLRTENYYEQIAIDDICIDLPGEPTEFLKGREFGVCITPQAQVGPYSLDFNVRVRCRDEYFNFDVECDGHEFHSSNFEAISHDLRRDDYVRSAGYVIMRLTGAEINQHPLMAAQRVTESIGMLINHCKNGNILYKK